MRLSRLRWPEWLIAAGSVLLVVSMLLLPWYAGSIDGWHGLHHARWLIVVTAGCGLVLAVLQAGLRSPAVPVTMTLFTTILGILSTVWLVYRVLIDPPGGDRLVGGFLGLAGVCAITYGGWRSLRMEGIAAQDAPPDIPIVEPLG